MDVDQRALLVLQRRDAVAVGGCLAQPRADHQQQIGRLDPLDQLGVRAIAQVPRIDRRGRRNRILPPERCRHRQAQTLGKQLEILAGFGVPARPADDRERRRGIADQRHHRLHRIGAGGLRGPRHSRPGRRLGRVVKHVFGQGEHHRARPPGDRGGIGTRDIFGNPVRPVDPRAPLGDRREEGGEVDLLKALAIAHVAPDVADEQDHRLAVLHGDMHPDAGIGRARPAGDEGNAGPPRSRSIHRAVGTGHERRAAFLPAGRHIDLRDVDQRVEHREKALARDGEDAIATLRSKAIDEQARSLRSFVVSHPPASRAGCGGGQSSRALTLERGQCPTGGRVGGAARQSLPKG